MTMQQQSRKNRSAKKSAADMFKTLMLVAGQKAITNALAADENYPNIPVGNHQFANVSLTINMSQVEINQLAPYQRPDNVDMPWTTIIALLLLEIPEPNRDVVRARIVNILKTAHEMGQAVTETNSLASIKKEIEDTIHFWKQELHHKMPPRTVKGGTKPTVLGVSFNTSK